MKFRILRFKSVNSTNDVAINLIKKNMIYPSIIISDIQTNGRGQRGKRWISIKGNIFMSLFFKINKKTQILEFTKKNCLIVKKILMKILNKKVSVKLPNDLIVCKKKICGILQETVQHNNQSYLIIGLGINLVNSPKIINYSTGYIEQFTKKKIDKNNILENIKKEFEINY